MKATKFTIDRSKWARGDRGYKPNMLLDDDGMMCCLGHYALACGLSEHAIHDLAGYESIADVDSVDALPAELINRNNDQSTPSTTELHGKLIQANDNPVQPGQLYREARITELFASIGVTVEFVDGVSP